MFYYRITTAGKRTYHEFLRKRDLGEYVAANIGRDNRPIIVKPISQRAYIAATRPGE